MRSSLRLPLALVGAALLPLAGAIAQDVRAEPAPPVAYSAEELDNLVAPIALYPDPILAQALVAATFPDQLQVAADYVREHGTAGVDDQEWDVSVRAIAHYAPVLNMMVERPDWTTALGQAYAAQSSDVMESVQHLRRLAQEQGNLESTPQQAVQVTNQYVSIVPANPRVIYIPTYDPSVIFFRHLGYLGAYPAYWSFGIGFPIGAWLTYDCDWYNSVVYYDGWMGGGWRIAARPFINFSVAYVSPRYAHVRINRAVLYRPVDYDGLRRFNTIHRTANFEARGRDRRADGRDARGWNGGGAANPGGRNRDDGRARGSAYNPGDTRGGDTRQPPSGNGRRGGSNGRPTAQPGSRQDGGSFGPAIVRSPAKPAPAPQTRASGRSFGPTIVRPQPQGREAKPAPQNRSSSRTVSPSIVRPPKRSGGEVIRATPQSRSSAGTIRPTFVRPAKPSPQPAPRQVAPTVRAPSRSPAVRSRPSPSGAARPSVSRGSSAGRSRSGSKGRP